MYGSVLYKGRYKCMVHYFIKVDRVIKMDMNGGREEYEPYKHVLDSGVGEKKPPSCGFVIMEKEFLST